MPDMPNLWEWIYPRRLRYRHCIFIDCTGLFPDESGPTARTNHRPMPDMQIGGGPVRLACLRASMRDNSITDQHANRRGRYAPKRSLRQRLHLIRVHCAVALRLAAVGDFEDAYAGKPDFYGWAPIRISPSSAVETPDTLRPLRAAANPPPRSLVPTARNTPPPASGAQRRNPASAAGCLANDHPGL